MSQKNIYWLTGLPSSGKSSIARDLSRHIYAEILDGDEIRSMTGNVGFSNEFRATHMRYVAAMAHYVSKHQDVIVSLVSPLRNIREEIKKKYSNIYEIYIKCPLEVCRERDTRGMYAKAIRGEITNFTGIQGGYEEPTNPDMIVRTDMNSIDECVKQILTLHKNTPKALLIGRWQPLHEGHKWLVQDMIRKMFGDSVGYLVLPDIVGVFYGRKVGYVVEELNPPEEIGRISATSIREKK